VAGESASRRTCRAELRLSDGARRTISVLHPVSPRLRGPASRLPVEAPEHRLGVSPGLTQVLAGMAAWPTSFCASSMTLSRSLSGRRSKGPRCSANLPCARPFVIDAALQDFGRRERKRGLLGLFCLFGILPVQIDTQEGIAADQPSAAMASPSPVRTSAM